MKRKIMPLEIIFSVIVSATILFIISLICLELKSYSQKITKQSEASIIASNIIENMKVRTFDDIGKYIDEMSYIGISKRLEGNIQYVTVHGNEFNEKFFGTEIPKDYVVELQIEKIGEEFEIIKKIILKVNYLVNRKSESLEVSTIIERENIDECNVPVITNEYLADINLNNEEYEIVPIKYSENKDSFVTTTKDDAEWFNYSVKRWAKIIAFAKGKESLKDLFINADGTVNEYINYNGQTLRLRDYIYVWIPNFSISDDITYFRYGTGKKAIKHDFLYMNGKYMYLNKTAEEIKDISEDCNFEGISGVWKRLDDEDDVYYSNFNQTKYAPINIY